VQLLHTFEQRRPRVKGPLLMFPYIIHIKNCAKTADYLQGKMINHNGHGSVVSVGKSRLYHDHVTIEEKKPSNYDTLA